LVVFDVALTCFFVSALDLAGQPLRRCTALPVECPKRLPALSRDAIWLPTLTMFDVDLLFFCFCYVSCRTAAKALHSAAGGITKKARRTSELRLITKLTCCF
jgi:hypothetical protein